MINRLKIKSKRNPSIIKINDMTVLDSKKVTVLFQGHFELISEGKLEMFGDPYFEGGFIIRDTKNYLSFPLNAIKTSYFKDKNPIIELKHIRG